MRIQMDLVRALDEGATIPALPHAAPLPRVAALERVRHPGEASRNRAISKRDHAALGTSGAAS
ncbi:MAG: hypothetical protein R3F59_36625 [Myxococcota bacterium]